MQEIKNINAHTLHDWLELGQVFLIDVREVSEFNLARIPNAKNLPLSQICKHEVDIPENQNKKIVLMCRSGVRSMTAYVKFLEADPSFDVYNLEGGIMAWQRDGYKTVN